MILSNQSNIAGALNSRCAFTIMLGTMPPEQNSKTAGQMYKSDKIDRVQPGHQGYTIIMNFG
jgi:hypothetical protein